MISRLSAELLVKRWSVALFVLLIANITTGVGGDNAAVESSKESNLNGDSSICRVVRDAKKSLLISFDKQFNTASDAFCKLADHCTNVTCYAQFTRDKLNAGLILNLCQADPELRYWVNNPQQWSRPWSHTFSSGDFGGHMERVEITRNQQNVTEGSSVSTLRWFIKVLFSITHGRSPTNNSAKYISFNSVLQICPSVAESSCTNTTLLNFPRLPQSQICDFHTPEPEDNGEYIASSSRSSRNANVANVWNPEEIHRQGGERALKGELVGAKPGDSCDGQSIFNCGPGALCVMGEGGAGGVCECFSNFFFNATSGVCEKKPYSPPDDPTSSDSVNSRCKNSSGSGFDVGALIVHG